MKTVKPTAFPIDPFVQTATELGTAIRAARSTSGLSILQAAEGLGISKQTLQDLERGTGTVGVGLALRVANQLGVALFVAPASRKELIRRRVTNDA